MGCQKQPIFILINQFANIKFKSDFAEVKNAIIFFQVFDGTRSFLSMITKIPYVVLSTTMFPTLNIIKPLPA